MEKFNKEITILNLFVAQSEDGSPMFGVRNGGGKCLWTDKNHNVVTQVSILRILYTAILEAYEFINLL